MNPQLIMAIFFFYTVNSVIQIFRIRAVNSHDGKAAEILHSFFLFYFLGKGIGFRHECFGKHMGQPVLGDNDVDINPFIPLIADKLRHFPLGICPRPGPSGHFHNHSGTGDSFQFLSPWYFNHHIDLFVNRYGFSSKGCHLISADKSIFRSFNDAEDFPFRIVTPRFSFFYTHFHDIIIDRIQMITVSNVHIFMLLIRDQESETRSVRFVDPLQNHAGTI